jgi:hypothetical protein
MIFCPPFAPLITSPDADNETGHFFVAIPMIPRLTYRTHMCPGIRKTGTVRQNVKTEALSAYPQAGKPGIGTLEFVFFVL